MRKQLETIGDARGISGGVEFTRRIWWGRMVRASKYVVIPFVGILVLAHAGAAEAQGFQRWFQVELTIFSNESATDRERETWRPDSLDLAFPPDMVRLGRLTDLLFLAWFAGDGEPEALEAEAEPPAPERARLHDTGPFPARGASGFRFPDLQRDPFQELPASYSDFRQTNQSLERAGQYRVLYNAVWRQPVGDAGSATPIFIAGGDRYGPLAELQGSVALQFNAGRDRVIFSADLWLAEFGGAAGGEQWSLPPPPEALVETLGIEPSGNSAAPAISRIYTMRQQRELRSGEFHYLDHPALGIVVQITPYDLPPPFELP